MSERFNILWIDDQFDEMPGFIDEASLDGLDLTPFKSSDEGMDYLREHLNEVDAVILDAKVFKHEANDTATEKGLMASLREIAKIQGQHPEKAIPHVVYTGQADLESDAVFADRMDEVKVHSKNKPNGALFERLKELIGDAPDATVRNQYRAAYDACGADKIDGKCWELLAPVLKSIELGVDLPHEPYNEVRKAVEWIFRYLHQAKVIHEDIIDANGMVGLGLGSRFLDGQVVKLRSGEFWKAEHRILPKLLADSLRYVLDVTQPGSHTEDADASDEDRASIAVVEAEVPDHRLLQCVSLMVVDLIQWAARYVRDHSDPQSNQQQWLQLSGPAGTEVTALPCRVINTRPKAVFVKPDDPTQTDGMNIRIPIHLPGANGLKEGDRVAVSAWKPTTWNATSVQSIS